jgi:hypothetical protein
MPTVNTYDYGDRVKFSVAFTDENGTAADPSIVTFKHKGPGGTVTTYVYGTDAELVQESTGNYYVLWTLTGEGHHYARFEGSGTLVAADETEVRVLDSAFY